MDNRTKLLNCAVTLFAMRGYDAVGIQEIVDCAKVTKPTLYHYFGNKQGLLHTLLQENYTPFKRQILEVADYKGDITQNITMLTKAYLEFADKNQLFYRLLLTLSFAPPQSEAFLAVKEHYEHQQNVLEEMFRRAVEDHGNMAGRQKAYAASLLGMINTYAAMLLNGNLTIDDQKIYRIVHQFMHGIFS